METLLSLPPHELAGLISALGFAVSEILGILGHGGISTLAAKGLQAFLSRPNANAELEAKVAELEQMIKNYPLLNPPPPQRPV